MAVYVGASLVEVVVVPVTLMGIGRIDEMMVSGVWLEVYWRIFLHEEIIFSFLSSW